MAQIQDDKQESIEIASQPKGQTSPSLPVLMLTVLGTVITVLGLFAAGDMTVVIVGLVSIAVAGLIHIFRPER